MIEALIQAAQTEVDNHSIYVWGGSGQLCCEVTHTVQKDELGNIVLVPVEAQE